LIVFSLYSLENINPVKREKRAGPTSKDQKTKLFINALSHPFDVAVGYDIHKKAIIKDAIGIIHISKDLFIFIISA